MSGKSKWDYLKAIYFRYKKASKALRSRILDEFCQVCHYNRKYAIRLLSGPAPQKPNIPSFKGRRPTYGTKVIGALTRDLASRRLSVLSAAQSSPAPVAAVGRPALNAFGPGAKTTPDHQPGHHRPPAG